MRDKRLLSGAMPLAATAMLAIAPAALADGNSCAVRVNNTFDKLLECVTLDGVRAHQQAFQEIADANGGTRLTGTPGYDASVDYVAQALEAAGYGVEIDLFEFEYVPPATLTQLTPINADYETGTFTGSGVGTVTAAVTGVDLALGNADWPADPSTATSGCEAGDFAGFPAGNIALIQRGVCFFSTKAANAEAAGASAVIIFNQGNTPEREGLIVGNAESFPDGTPSNLTIPVVGASFLDGVALAQAGSTAFINVDPNEIRTGANVIAELPGRAGGNVVMAGAHLDSVLAGPGIQDNGAASAAILETAIQMAKVKPRNTVRFAWWGGGELGLIGSYDYVGGLSEEELARIALYLNFDIIASPNYVFFILDGDNSDGESLEAPEGSDQIECLFEHYYTQAGFPFKGSPILGGSDWEAFFLQDIPIGGIFTGSDGIKTDEEVALWGGTAGEQYDPCYHLACDTFDNVSLQALDVNSDAVAYSILQYGMNTQAINGERGKGNFKPAPGNSGAAME